MKLIGDTRYNKPDVLNTLPTYQVTRVFTAAEVNLLDTVPITLVQAPGAGLFYLPEYIIARKEAGTAYTTAAQIGVGNSAFYFGITGVGFLDQVTLQRRYRNAPALATDDPTTYLNQPLKALTNGAISGGTGRVVLTVGYKIIQVDGFF